MLNLEMHVFLFGIRRKMNLFENSNLINFKYYNYTLIVDFMNLIN